MFKMIFGAAALAGFAQATSAAVIEQDVVVDISGLSASNPDLLVDHYGLSGTVYDKDSVRFVVDFLEDQSLSIASLDSLLIHVDVQRSNLAAYSVKTSLDFLGSTGNVLWTASQPLSGGYTGDFRGYYATGSATPDVSVFGIALTATFQLVSSSGPNPASITLDRSQTSLNGFTPAAVPEPASWVMMISGFGGVGCALRRRKGLRPALAQ